MDSIEPYDYKEFTEFNSAYLSGFFAEKYDLTSDDVYDRAKTRMENTTINMLKSTVNGYSSVDIQNKVTDIKQGEIEYALLPVWMLNIKYQDKDYTFAMNGQTKKVVGKVPVDKKKVLKKGSISFLIAFIISFAIVFLYNMIGGL